MRSVVKNSCSIITSPSRRRPRRTPRVKLYPGVFLLGRIPGFRVQPNGDTPFLIGRQPVLHALGQRPGSVLSFGQPFTKCRRVVPADANDRIGRALFKPGILPGCPPLLPAVIAERPHSVRRVVTGAVDEHAKVFHARIPNAKKRQRPGDRHEFHPKAVLPRLLLRGFRTNVARLFSSRRVGDSQVSGERRGTDQKACEDCSNERQGSFSGISRSSFAAFSQCGLPGKNKWHK